jgi:hypothetical protein
MKSAISSDGDRAVHFGDATGMAKPITRNDLNQERELKADPYCAIRALSAKRSIDLETFLIGLINNELEAKVGVVTVAGVGTLWDYTNQHVVEYLNAGDHPEYVVRATRLLIASADASGSTGISSLAKSFMNHMQEKLPAP